MSENNTIARPYAKAAFEVAKSEKTFEAWSNLLWAAQAMISDKSFLNLVKHPKFSDEEALKWMTEILGDVMHDHGVVFLRMLAQSDRLTVLPEIYQLFEAYKRDSEKALQAYVSSASPLSEDYLESVKKALKIRLGVENVELHCQVDKALLAGAIIKAGDIVIDGSARGRLSRLSEALGV